MCQVRLRICGLLFSLLAVVSTASGRGVNDWDFRLLSDRADVVVIVRATSEMNRPIDLDISTLKPWASQDLHAAGNQKKLYNLFERFSGRVSTFEVYAVLKGELKDLETQPEKLPRDKIRVLHVAMKGEQGPNPPMVFVQGLHAKDASGESAKNPGKQPHYLLFLSRRDDGYFEPVTECVDGAFSVKAITQELRVFANE